MASPLAAAGVAASGGGFGDLALVFEAVHQRARRLVGGQARGHELIQRCDIVPGADLASVLGVVVEVLFGEQTVFITDEPVLAHHGGIELDLDFHILRHGDERAVHLLDEHFARLAQAVYVAVVAVALVGQGFHGAVLQVPGAEAEHAEEDAAARLFGDEAFQLGRIADAHVESRRLCKG